MEKIVLECEQDYFANKTYHYCGRKYTIKDKPEDYPCILIVHMEDNPDEGMFIHTEYVYRKNFNQKK